MEDAAEFLGKRQENYEKTGSPQFAITHRDGYFIGGIGLRINKENESGELGYWIGKPFWEKVIAQKPPAPW